MYIRFSVAALFILASTGANAFSSDYDWTGFYAGIFGGLNSGKLDTDIVGGNSPATTSISGATVGVTAGANYQIDQYVLGIEGDLAWSNIIGDSACSPTQTCTSKLNWVSTIRGRTGFVIDNSLLYSTAGVAISNGTSVTSPATVGSTGTDTQTFVGWTAGIGGEYAIDQNIKLKAEYSYTDLGSRSSPVGTVSLNNSIIAKPTFHTIKFGINFAFPTK